MGAHASRVPCSASRRTPSSHHFSPTKWLTGFVPARPCHRPASPCVNSCSLGSIRGSTALLWLQPVPRRCPIGLQARKVIAQAEASPTSAGLGIRPANSPALKGRHPASLFTNFQHWENWFCCSPSPQSSPPRRGFSPRHTFRLFIAPSGQSSGLIFFRGGNRFSLSSGRGPG